MIEHKPVVDQHPLVWVKTAGTLEPVQGARPKHKAAGAVGVFVSLYEEVQEAFISMAWKERGGR